MHIPNYGMFFSIAPTKTNVCFDIFLMIHGFIQFFNMITHKNLNFHFFFFFFFLFQNNMEKEIQILTFLNNLILDQLFVFLYQRCSIFLHFFFSIWPSSRIIINQQFHIFGPSVIPINGPKCDCFQALDKLHDFTMQLDNMKNMLK